MASLAQRRRDLVTSMMREGIYEAAVAVLTERGLDGMTMDRVAAEAGVGKASLYKYFGNKQEMLQFVHEKALEPVMQAVAAVLREALPAERKLETTLRTWFEYLGEHRGLFNLFFNDHVVGGLLQPSEVSARESAMRNVSTIIQQGIDEGVFRPVETTRVALLMLGAARQIAEQKLAADGQWAADELTAMVMDFFLHGLRKDS